MVSKLPLVSIITPVYNGARYIGELIESVARQKYPNIEHIIIDDGSTDDGATVAILKSYPRLKWWSRENRGQYSTMNEGLQAANGEIVCFISADDLMTDTAVELVINEFLENPDCEGVYGKVVWIQGDGSLRAGQEVITHGPLWLNYFKQFIVHCSFYVKKKSLMDNALFFETTLHFTGDYDWIIRIIKSGLKLRYVDCDLSMIRDHAQRATIRNLEQMALENKLIHQRHGINRFLVKLVLFILRFITRLRLYSRVGFSGPQSG